MNYYWFKSLDGSEGNCYAENEQEVYKKILKSFDVIAIEVELLKKNCKVNFLNGKEFK